MLIAGHVFTQSPQSIQICSSTIGTLNPSSSTEKDMAPLEHTLAQAVQPEQN